MKECNKKVCQWNVLVEIVVVLVTADAEEGRCDVITVGGGCSIVVVAYVLVIVVL